MIRLATGPGHVPLLSQCEQQWRVCHQGLQEQHSGVQVTVVFMVSSMNQTTFRSELLRTIETLVSFNFLDFYLPPPLPTPLPILLQNLPHYFKTQFLSSSIPYPSQHYPPSIKPLLPTRKPNPSFHQTVLIPKPSLTYPPDCSPLPSPNLSPNPRCSLPSSWPASPPNDSGSDYLPIFSLLLLFSSNCLISSLLVVTNFNISSKCVSS